MPNVLNTWGGGRNSDTNPRNIPNNQYIEGVNVELTESGEFFSLTNIAGTTAVQQISGIAGLEVLGAFATKYLIDDEQVDCITIFTADTVGGSTHPFKILAYDTEHDVLYELYEQTVAVDYNTVDRVVDAIYFPENNVGRIFFTDNYHEIRYLKCEIPSPYSANFLTSYDLSLLRRGGNGAITSSVDAGGTLLSGTYQFVYRMADPTNKRFTKWSTPTNPVHVYSKANDSTPVYSGIGLITGRMITLTITPSTEETDNFDYLQVAVIPNIGPTDPVAADLLEIEAIAGTSLTYEYKSNSRIGTIPLEDITVDLAQIQKAKTLNIKDNRLFVGNVTYADLEMDNGTPAITSGSIISQASADVDSFSSDEFASNYRGYWRGEVYRYGIVYEDEFGNKSSVQPLDLSGVTGNDITVGLTDMKFPDRTNASYTLFNASGQLQSLGLRLTGLNNHPSWARKLEIVRVDRKGRFKNILFQTPIIPMCTVHGVGALDSYPTTLTYKEGADNERTEENATPMTSGHTLVPKNLFWPEQRAIYKNSSAGSGSTRLVSGEVRLQYVGTSEGYTYSMIFPPDSMYNSTDRYAYTGSEKVDFVDYALLKATITDSNPSKTVTVVSGDDINTNVTGTFHATADNQYYFNNGHGKSAISPTDRAITDYEFFDNLNASDTVAGKAIMDYEALQTGGINFGFKPDIQRCAVVKVSGQVINDVSAEAKTFSAATWNARGVGGGALSSASASLLYEVDLTNKYINEYGVSLDSLYVNVVAIANVKLGLGDDRYGESTDLQEYISTGCKYTFSAAEVATLEAGGDVVLGDLDVWGGDCVVSSHVFKISDSSYSVVNQSKNIAAGPPSVADNLSKWNNVLFKDLVEGNSFLCIPISVENAAQYVQVILESEYNGAIREQDILEGSSAAIPVMTGSVATARTPLTYRYNINLNKNNSQKIYVSEPQFSFKQSEFGARVHWTDLKIYNSDQQGFDIFRVADFYDIEEKYGTITKLALAGDNLYSIHDQAVIYLQTGERQVEQADGGILAVRSGDVIGGKIIIDSERGCQHLRGVIETGNIIYVPDNRNKSVYALSGQQLVPISKDNETVFRGMFSSKIGARYVVGLYDPIRQQYWLADSNPASANTNCQIFNEKLGFWVSNHQGFGKKLMGGAYGNQNLYVIGPNGADTSIYTMYTGDISEFFGVVSPATVKFSVNPHPNVSKTFDNFLYFSSNRLSSVDYEVPREIELGSQTATLSLDIEPYEGSYRGKNPRAAGNARLRGTYLLMTVTWKTIQSALNAVETIYRRSY